MIRFRSVFLTALLVCAFSAGSGCAVLSKKAASSPQAVATVTIQSLDVLAAAGTVAVSVRAFERDLFQRQVITTSQDAAFNVAFAKTQAAADKAIDLVKSGGLTLKAAVASILATLNDLRIAGQSGLSAIVDSLKTLLSLGGPASTPVPIAGV